MEKEEIIYGITIKHNGDVKTGLDYIRNYWNSNYVLKVFKDARSSSDHDGVLKIDDVEGFYLLRHLKGDTFSLKWVRQL
ncbi:MAG: hypothetical protein KBD52_00160 [Candidatus Pacebacteria bacterium]|nr:hypothetical protein [Candidatus Paceibacterota bacterium]